MGYVRAGVNLAQMSLTGHVVQAAPRPLALVPPRNTPANQVCILYFHLELVYIPFTNEFEDRIINYRPSFSSSIYGLNLWYGPSERGW